MALKPCKECGKEVSTDAKKCPHCGATYPTVGKIKIGKKGWIAIVSIFVILAFIDIVNNYNKSHGNNPDLIHETELQNALKNIPLSFEVQTGKSVKNGKLIAAVGVVPFDITKEQVRSTLLSTTKKIMLENPECAWIFVQLLPCPEVEGHGHSVGYAEYKEGLLDLRYGIPSDKQIADWNSMVEEKHLDLPRLFRPDQQTFDQAKDMYLLFDKNYRQATFETNADISEDEQIYNLTSQQTGHPVEDIKEKVRFFTSYYSITWGNETIGEK